MTNQIELTVASFLVGVLQETKKLDHHCETHGNLENGDDVDGDDDDDQVRSMIVPCTVSLLSHGVR